MRRRAAHGGHRIEGGVTNVGARVLTGELRECREGRLVRLSASVQEDRGGDRLGKDRPLFSAKTCDNRGTNDWRDYAGYGTVAALRLLQQTAQLACHLFEGELHELRFHGGRGEICQSL
jgi:hypothetical protein